MLALNSSPRKERGGTATVLDLFLKGAKEAGADIDLVYVHGLDIKPCLGCFVCWIKTPSVCVQKDDMEEILRKRRNADAIILATPVYVDGMTSTLKAVLDRSIPLVKPFFEIRDGHCRHPPQYNREPIKVVLVSVSGFTELDNFDPLVMHVKAFCKNLNGEFAGTVLRPLGAQLPMFKKMGLPVDDIYDAIRRAGKEFVENGKINSATQDEISREIVPRGEYIKRLNEGFQQALDAN
ncbi:MAG: flavodoxin family protein [Promethearchaeota archaeon]